MSLIIGEKVKQYLALVRTPIYSIELWFSKVCLSIAWSLDPCGSFGWSDTIKWQI